MSALVVHRAIAPATIVFTLVFTAFSARAADDGASSDASAIGPAHDAASEAPVVGYAYSTGVARRTVGAMAFGNGTIGGSTFGGGGSVWGSPISRLTLIADAQRDVTGQFTPSTSVILRLLGDHAVGWSLGALGKFKVDGFSRGVDNELETEVESGLLLSFARERFHFDVNAIGGVGLGDDRDVDAEARLRIGYDLASFVRLGLDEQARYKLQGAQLLPGKRRGDFAGGAQLMIFWKHFFGAITAGPTTMGVVDRTVGWMALLSVGGTT